MKLAPSVNEIETLEIIEWNRRNYADLGMNLAVLCATKILRKKRANEVDTKEIEIDGSV